MELEQVLLVRSAKECWKAQAGEYGNQGVSYAAIGTTTIMRVSPQLAGHFDGFCKMLAARGIEATWQQEHDQFLLSFKR